MCCPSWIAVHGHAESMTRRTVIDQPSVASIVECNDGDKDQTNLGVLQDVAGETDLSGETNLSALIRRIGPPPAPPPGLEEPFQQPPPTAFCGFGAEAEAFGPPMLVACIRAAAAAGEEAATCRAAAAVCALQLEAELDSLVARLSQDFMADVEPLLARAVDESRAFGFHEVETHLYDALLAACFRHLPIDYIAAAVQRRRTGPHHAALCHMIMAAFGRDFSPGAEGYDGNLWSRVMGARYHVYRSGVGGRDPAAVASARGRRRRSRGNRPSRRSQQAEVVAATATAAAADTGAEDDL